jgi:CPA2 family monovalent cation:H+ antiporter-2
VHGSAVLQDLVLLYTLALVMLLIGGRLGLPGIVSLIVTGGIAGPGGLGLVRDETTISVLSEVGIALLLFMVGLDLSFGEVRRLWRSVVGGGSAQVIGTMAIAAPVAWWLVRPSIGTVVVIGLFVAVSNTSIVIREMTRRNELYAPHGALAVGILLLQDLVALVALVLMPVLLGASASPGLGWAILQIVVVAGGLAMVTRFLLPLLFRLATASGREAFGLMVLVASLGTAWLASMLGLSMTVGAFLAGLVLDESEFSHQIHAEIRPLRDLLTSLFFISVGLVVQPLALGPVWHWVAGATLGIVALKTVGGTAALLLVGVPARVAGSTALVLAEIGEFSFVLGRQAVEAGVVDDSTSQVLLAASVLTMMGTPWLVRFAPAFGDRVAALSRRAAAPEDAPDRSSAMKGHVIILGVGVGGRLISDTLREIHTPHVILELNGRAVQAAAEEGHHIYYADATSPEPLRAAGVARAAAVVAVLSDPGATERAVRIIRALNPRVPIVVRTRFRLEARRMMMAGATMAVAEELEGSLEVMAQTLVRLDVPANVAEVLVASARRAAGAGESPRTLSAPHVPLDVVSGTVGQTPVSSYRLAAEHGAVGRTLGSINLRAETGATVVAVKRDEATQTAPAPDWVFEAGDVLYLVGDEADVQLARARLAGRPEVG